MAICSQCKEIIDDDSRFCDQCGCLLYVCPNCHIIGKGEGKRCGQCGKLLVASTVAFAAVHINDNSQTKLSNNVASSVAIPAYLVCIKENLRLPLIDNAIIGRTCGDYVSKLSNKIYISGTHARLNKSGNSWSITDLNSRNGTEVNGKRCNPTLQFSLGDIIRIAKVYDFKVE